MLLLRWMWVMRRISCEKGRTNLFQEVIMNMTQVFMVLLPCRGGKR